MVSFVEQKRAAIEALCHQFGVQRLEVFGSATGSKFDTATSDLDFLVEFRDLPIGMRADAYFGLLKALEDLFQRDVDLVTAAAVKNPFLRESIERSKTLLYAA